MYIGYNWLQAVLIDAKAKISFSTNRAKDNTFMESFNGNFKGENGSMFYDAANIRELRRAVGMVVGMQVGYDNAQRRHS